MYTIATLYQLQQRLGLSPGVDEARLLEALQAATAQIERAANRRFCPRSAALDHAVDPDVPTELLLDDDLLELTFVTNNDTTIPLDDIISLPGDGGPAGLLKLTNGQVFTWAETPLRAVTVSGIWGWHDDWSRAWRDSGDQVQNNPLATGETALSVADADGADGAGQSPRFQVGHLIKIGAEYLRVLSVTINDPGNDTLTVQRAVSGTQESAHTQGTAIYTFQPAPDTNILALRWAAWLYREPDSPQWSENLSALLRSLAPLRRVAVKS